MGEMEGADEPAVCIHMSSKSCEPKCEEEHIKELKEKDKVIQQLQDDMAKLATQANYLNYEVDRSQKEISGLNEIIQQHETNTLKLRESHRESVLDVQNHLEIVTSKYRTVISELQKQLEKERQTCSQQTRQLERQRSDLEKQCETCSAETERLGVLLHDKMAEQQKDRKVIAELEQKLLECCSMCLKFQEKLDFLETVEFSESVLSFERHEKPTTSEETKTDNNSKLDLQMHGLKDTVKRLEKQLNIAIDTRSKLSKREKDLSDAKADLRVNYSKLQNAEKAIIALKVENDRLQDALKEKREEEHDKTFKHTSELSQLRKELLQTKLTLANATEALVKERDAVKISNSNLESFQADVSTAQEQICLLEHEVETLKHEVKELLEERIHIQSKLTEVQDDGVFLVDNAMKLPANLEAVREEIRLVKEEASKEKSLRLIAEECLSNRNDELTKAHEKIKNLIATFSSAQDCSSQEYFGDVSQNHINTHVEAEVVAPEEEEEKEVNIHVDVDLEERFEERQTLHYGGAPLSEEKNSNASSVKKKSKQKKCYKCGICGKKLKTKGILKSHMFTHSYKKRFKCNDCNKGFNAKRDLMDHISSIHTGVKPFKCTFCTKSFNRNLQLTRHEEAKHKFD